MDQGLHFFDPTHWRMDKGNQERINLCCEVWRCSQPKPNSVQSCPSPKFQHRASTVHRYIYNHLYNFCLSSSVSDQHTLSTLGSKPNKARAMISEPRPVCAITGHSDGPSVHCFFHKLSGNSQRAHLTHHFFKSFLGDNWFLSWLAWWTFIFLHIEAFDFSCQGLHPARLHLMPWLPNSPYFDCRSIICVVSHNTYDYQERIRGCYYYLFHILPETPAWTSQASSKAELRQRRACKDPGQTRGPYTHPGWSGCV